MKVQTKLGRLAGMLLTSAALMLSSACSSSQQDEEDLELSGNENQQGNLGEDDAAEGNGQENFENEQGNYEQGNYEQGAEVNNDTENEFETAELDNGSGGNAMFSNGGATAMNPAPMNAAPMNPAPMNAGMGMPAPASNPETAPVPGGRVRYVREGGVQVMNSPGGSPVFSLEQGDHPVTWEENGWLRISNGMYVPVDSMSDAGIGRPIPGTRWGN